MYRDAVVYSSAPTKWAIDIGNSVKIHIIDYRMYSLISEYTYTNLYIYIYIYIYIYGNKLISMLTKDGMFCAKNSPQKV